MELQRHRRGAEGKGLVGEILSPGRQQMGAGRQIEAVEMPLVDAARKPRRAQTVGRGRRENREIADFAAAVGIAEDTRAEMPRQHLRAQANAEQRLLLAQGNRQPVDFALDPIAVVVGAHRPAEHHDAVVIGERLGQGFLEAGAADVEPGAERAEDRADASRRRMALMQDQENRLAPDALGHRHAPRPRTEGPSRPRPRIERIF